MLQKLKSVAALFTDRSGVTAVEYAVIAGVVVVSVAAAFNALGSTLKTFFTGLSL